MNPGPEVTNLDLRGLKCPTPVVTTSKAVRRLGGRAAVLRILADDDGFPADLESWCRATKSELMSLDRSDDGVFSAMIRVNSNGHGNNGNGVVSQAQSAKSSGRISTLRGAVAQARRKRLDFRGKRCPEPIILLAKEARQHSDGSELEVLADDDSFPMDVKSWCRSAGATLISLDREDNAYRALLKPKAKNGEVAVASPPAAGTAFEAGGTNLGSPGAPASPRVVEARQSGAHAIVAPVSDRTEISAPPMQMAPSPAPASSEQDDTIRVDLSSMPPQAFRQYLETLDQLDMPGAMVAVSGRHSTFAQDIATWCARRGHSIVRLNTDSSPMVAEVALVARSDRMAIEDGPTVALDDGAASPSTALVAASRQLPAEFVDAQNSCTLLVLHNDLEALLAALMTANAAASSGMKVTVFFAFWGINVLRGDRPRKDLPKEKVSFMQGMFKRMMPKGPKRQRLGKLSFGGMGGSIMRGIMKSKSIMQVEELMAQAIEMDVRFTACTTSMAVMGITRRDLMELPNMEFAGVTSFVDYARGAGVSLVF